MKYPTSRCFKGILSLLFLFTFTNFLSAQVGIGTLAPDADSVLDITSTDKGALLPRVNLTSTASVAPLSAHVTGMIVYNQVAVNDVTPGYYYNNGSAWVSLGEANDEWKLNGNASTSPGANYLGNIRCCGPVSWYDRLRAITACVGWACFSKRCSSIWSGQIYIDGSCW